MLSNFLILLIVCSVLITLVNWRRGVFCMVLVAALQDPIRKLTPGAPALYTLCVVPIWVAMLVAATVGREAVIAHFRATFPRLAGRVMFFLLTLVPPMIVTLTYGPNSWKIALVGSFAYISLIMGIAIGSQLSFAPRQIERIILFYCVATAVMMTGSLIEHFQMYPNWMAVGTEALGMKWIRYRTDYTVSLVSGFYRSPDIMGWHAAVLSMLALTMAFLKRGAWRFVWMGVASWGMLSLMLCGRRKMSMMVPVFVVTLGWIYLRSRGKGAVLKWVLVFGIAALITYGLSVQTDVGSEVGMYYFVDTSDVAARLQTTAYEETVWTLFHEGTVFGRGLGTATQGVQHLGTERPRTWQESGLGRLAVEVGVFGFIGIGALGICLVRLVLSVASLGTTTEASWKLYAGLVAVFVANGASFVVSGQVFGDPFINCWFAMLTGLCLTKMYHRQDPTVAPAPPPWARR